LAGLLITHKKDSYTVFARKLNKEATKFKLIAYNDFSKGKVIFELEKQALQGF